MVDLTPQELSWQGLTPESFNGLDAESREFVVGRALFYRDVKNRTLVAELLKVMASELADKKLIVDVLEGRNKRGVEAARIIVRDFKKSGMQDIREYYLCFYGGKALQVLTGVKEQQAPASNGQSARDVEYIVSSAPDAVPQSASKSGDRRAYVASQVSKWTGTPAENILRMDADLVDRIISFADSNAGRGVTVEAVCGACESMIGDESIGVQFPMEIFVSHKDELLTRVLSPKG